MLKSPLTIFRYSNVYGPNATNGIVKIAIDRIKNGLPVNMHMMNNVPGDKGCIRDYIYIDDVVSANLMALDGKLQGTFNVSSNIGSYTQWLLEKIASLMGVEPDIKRLAGRPGGDIDVSILSNKKIKGYGCHYGTSLEDGLRETIENY